MVRGFANTCGLPVAVVLGGSHRRDILWQRTFKGHLLHRSSFSWLRWCVVHGSRQDLCHGSPHLRDTTGLRNPRLSTLLDKAHAVGTQSVAGEKNDPLTNGGRLLQE